MSLKKIKDWFWRNKEGAIGGAIVGFFISYFIKWQGFNFASIYPQNQAVFEGLTRGEVAQIGFLNSVIFTVIICILIGMYIDSKIKPKV